VINFEGAFTVALPDLLSERHEIDSQPLILNSVEALTHQMLIQTVTVSHPNMTHRARRRHHTQPPYPVTTTYHTHRHRSIMHP